MFWTKNGKETSWKHRSLKVKECENVISKMLFITLLLLLELKYLQDFHWIIFWCFNSFFVCLFVCYFFECDFHLQFIKSKPLKENQTKRKIVLLQDILIENLESHSIFYFIVSVSIDFWFVLNLTYFLFVVHQNETVFYFRHLSPSFELQVSLFILLVAFVSAIILTNQQQKRQGELQWTQKCTCLINEIAKVSGIFFNKFTQFKMTVFFNNELIN